MASCPSPAQDVNWTEQTIRKATDELVEVLDGTREALVEVEAKLSTARSIAAEAIAALEPGQLKARLTERLKMG